jgi:tight adherence protein C
LVLLLILGVGVLAGAVYLIGEATTYPARQRAVSIRRAATYGRPRFRRREREETFRERVLDPAKSRLASAALRLTPRATADSVAAKLLAAGLSRTVSLRTFLAGKSAAGIVGFFFGALLGGMAGGPLAVLVFAGGLGVLGFTVPDFVVSMRARTRREHVRSELPDALDLLAVSVEAGLGFDGALTKLTEHMEGPLCEEFTLTLNEIRMGESRHDALKRLVERVPAPEMAAFVRALIQADQLGISLGRILRVQAADTRLRRQAAAEEKAMKAPIKMLFPTVLFIFPCMFIVILGPALLNISKIF